MHIDGAVSYTSSVVGRPERMSWVIKPRSRGSAVPSVAVEGSSTYRPSCDRWGAANAL